MPALSTLAAIGLGLSAIGTTTAVVGAAKSADAQKQQIGLERQAEEQRRGAMELDARRKSLEVIRMQQRARAHALTAATGQGAQYSSGLQGGYGQIGGQSETNLGGISSGLATGENIFDINSQISQQKIAMANAGTMSATGQGLTSMGNNLVNSLPNISKLSGSMDGFNMGLLGKFRWSV